MDINEIRRKKLHELSVALGSSNEPEAHQQEQANIEEQTRIVENTAKQFMTKEARTRFNNVKLAHPELALKAAAAIVQAAASGRTTKVDDDELKQLLVMLKQKKEFRLKL